MRVHVWQRSSACTFLIVLLFILNASAQAYNSTTREVAPGSGKARIFDDRHTASEGKLQNESSLAFPVTTDDPPGKVTNIFPRSPSPSLPMSRDGIQSASLDPATQDSFRKAMIAARSAVIAKTTKDPRKKALARNRDKMTKVNGLDKAFARPTTHAAHDSLPSGSPAGFMVGDLLVQLDPKTDEPARQRFLMLSVQPAARLERLKGQRQQMGSMPAQGHIARIKAETIRSSERTADDDSSLPSPVVTADNPHGKVTNILPRSPSPSLQAMSRDGIQSASLDPASQDSFRKAIATARRLPVIAEAAKDRETMHTKKVLSQGSDKKRKRDRFDKAISRQTAHAAQISLKTAPQLRFLVGDLLVQFDPKTDEAARQRFLMQPVQPTAQIERYEEQRQQTRSMTAEGRIAARNTEENRSSDNDFLLPSPVVTADSPHGKVTNILPRSPSPSLQAMSRDGIQSASLDPATQDSFRKAMITARLPGIAEATKAKDTLHSTRVMSQSSETRKNKAAPRPARHVAHASSKSAPQLRFRVGDLLVQFDPETDEAAKQRFLMQAVLPAKIERFEKRRQQLRPIRNQGQLVAVNAEKIRGGDNGEGMGITAMVRDILTEF